MHILFICNTFFPFVRGGAELHVHRVARHLSQRNRITVLYQTTNTGSKVRFPNDSVKQLIIRSPRTALTYVLKGLVKALATRNQYDLIHAHTALSPMILGLLLSIILQKPLLVTAHGSDVRVFGSGLIKILQRIAFKFSTTWTCVSNEIHDILVSDYGFAPEKVQVIINGFDEGLLLKEIHEQDGLFRVSFVGSLRKEKNPLLLIAIAQILKGIDCKFRIDVVGDGPLKSDLIDRITGGAFTAIIHLHGELPHAKTMDVVASSDVFLMTSIHEGLPISMMEAMAMAKPVVAPRVGGIPEVVRNEQNGVLVTSNNAMETADALLNLCKSGTARRRLGKAARETVKPYSWSLISKRYEALYHSIRRNH